MKRDGDPELKELTPVELIWHAASWRFHDIAVDIDDKVMNTYAEELAAEEDQAYALLRR